MIGILAFIVGLSFGSFLNVVVYRYGSRSLFSDRSRCLSCGRTLRWYELVPVGSFILQRGRCRSCRTRLSYQYPLVELSAGIVFLLVLLQQHGLPQSLFSLAIWCLLIAICAYDFEHKIIPDGLVYTFIVLSFGQLLLFSPSGTLSVLDLAAGPILFLPFFALWFYSQGKWMGLGDGKLVLGIGWFLGLWSGINALVLAFWIGAVVSVFLVVLPRFSPFRRLFSGVKGLTMKSEVPFGPFLVFGTFLVFFFGMYVFPLPL